MEQGSGGGVSSGAVDMLWEGQCSESHRGFRGHDPYLAVRPSATATNVYFTKYEQSVRGAKKKAELRAALVVECVPPEVVVVLVAATLLADKILKPDVDFVDVVGVVVRVDVSLVVVVESLALPMAKRVRRRTRTAKKTPIVPDAEKNDESDGPK